MTLLEPDVTLTDYGLAIECVLLAALLRRRRIPGDTLCLWFIVFFGALGAGAVLGGTAHGFFPDEHSAVYKLIWSATLLAIGLAGLAGWAAGAWLLFSPPAARAVIAVAAAGFAVYTLAVLSMSRAFGLAILYYLPAAVFLFAALWRSHQRAPHGLAGMMGIGLTFVAAGVQQAGFELHPKYFNHNALYHLIQAAALFLIYRAARGLQLKTSLMEETC